MIAETVWGVCLLLFVALDVWMQCVRIHEAREHHAWWRKREFEDARRHREFMKRLGDST